MTDDEQLFWDEAALRAMAALLTRPELKNIQLVNELPIIVAATSAHFANAILEQRRNQRR